MLNTGIMEQIRGLLSQGQSSGEVILLGFRPQTVYKVQRKLTRETFGSNSTPGHPPPSPSTEDYAPNTGKESENIGLRREVANLKDRLDRAVYAEAELESEMLTLRDRVTVLEGEAVIVVDQLRHQMQQLKGRLDALTHTKAIHDNQFGQWDERWDRLMSLIRALCTKIHCSDEVMVVDRLPEHLKRLSDEAMELVRKHSQYRGELLFDYMGDNA